MADYSKLKKVESCPSWIVLKMIWIIYTIELVLFFKSSYCRVFYFIEVLISTLGASRDTKLIIFVLPKHFYVFSSGSFTDEIKQFTFSENLLLKFGLFWSEYDDPPGKFELCRLRAQFTNRKYPGFGNTWVLHDVTPIQK